MKVSTRQFIPLIGMVFVFLPMILEGQSSRSSALEITRIALFSSGVGYFEHAGVIKDDAVVPLLFSPQAMNDVLKSFVVHDPGTVATSVRYASEDTLQSTLRSLKIDLSGNPDVAQILDKLRGSEIKVNAPAVITGRILGVEKRSRNDSPESVAYLSLVTADGIKVMSLSEISSFSFTDPAIASDLARALDLLMSSRNASTREIDLNLPGKGERKVLVGYVVPVPVWKASYRLDLGEGKPVIQGWAIVDNAGDSDWTNVELSLVTGKPVSFVQELYPPLFFSRPILPLAIAGAASATVYETGIQEDQSEERSYGDEESKMSEMAAPSPMMKSLAAPSVSAGAAFSRDGVRTENTAGRSAGDMFLFTVAKPVSIARHESAMLPLVEAEIKAEKMSVFSGSSVQSGGSVHPKLCAEIVNTSGMRLPAGPVTVFDGGSYVGDALVEFLPEGDRRIIAFGEDLAVNASMTRNESVTLDKFSIIKGVMTITRKYTYAKTYTLKNAGLAGRKIIIEHPFVSGAVLVSPAKYDEKTDSAYRFSVSLPAKGDVKLDVKEQLPGSESISLADMSLDTILAFTSSGEVSSKIRSALTKAAELKRSVEIADQKISNLEGRRQSLFDNQERVRQNLAAAGNESEQGKDYLQKLSSLDGQIDATEVDIETAKKEKSDAQDLFDGFLSGLILE